MNILPKATPAETFNSSKAVALSIAQTDPQSVFCLFAYTQDGKKVPYKRSGQGVARDTPASQLFSAEDVTTMDEPPHGTHLGLVMQNPVIQQGGYLVCLDVDMKRSTGPTNIAIQRMASWVKEHNQLTEVSVSGRGRHIFLWVSADDADKIKPKYKLGGGQEIEVFGLPSSAGKSVLLSGIKLIGRISSDMHDNLYSLLTMWGVIQEDEKQLPKIDFSPLLANDEPKPAPAPTYQPSSLSDELAKAISAISFISPDCEYSQWIEIGQALHTGFGAQGLSTWEQWSSSGSKYKGPNDIATHWKSFHQGKGVGLGTLFHMAKENGWQPPTKAAERKSAVEEFKHLIQAQKPSEPHPTTKPSEDESYWPEVTLDVSKLEPIDYLVDGFLAHSFSIIAGQPGVGKTTATLAVCLVIAGFKINGSTLKTEQRRKVLYVTEDIRQIRQSLYAYCKYCNLDPKELKDWFIPIESKRSQVPDILKLAENIQRHTTTERPFLVIDTANATLDIENENDNSEVGSYMAALKQTIYNQLNTSIAIITHTAKTADRQDDAALARGASAFTGDATLTAVLFMDEEKNRYLRLVKTRYEPVNREIRFTTQLHSETVISRHGNPQSVICLTVTPEFSSEEIRKSDAAERIEANKSQRLMDKCDMACSFVQSVLNEHPEGVVIRRGSNAPKAPRNHPNAYQLDWSDIYDAVPGSTKGDAKKFVGEAVLRRFAQSDENNAWVLLSGHKGPAPWASSKGDFEDV